MNRTRSRLTVFFSEPFWIGVYERESNGCYEACKITFGAEPKDYEVYAFLLKNWGRLQFSPSVGASALPEKPANPKRMQRDIRKQLLVSGVGTKAQQALKLQQQQSKSARKIRCREAHEMDLKRRFALRQQKRREKHRGH
ncbi:MAG: YjdF family protein [Intestinibacillus sp.]